MGDRIPITRGTGSFVVSHPNDKNVVRMGHPEFGHVRSIRRNQLALQCFERLALGLGIGEQHHQELHHASCAEKNTNGVAWLME